MENYLKVIHKKTFIKSYLINCYFYFFDNNIYKIYFIDYIS